MRNWPVGVLALGLLASAGAAPAQEVDEYLQVSLCASSPRAWVSTRTTSRRSLPEWARPAPPRMSSATSRPWALPATATTSWCPSASGASWTGSPPFPRSWPRPMAMRRGPRSWSRRSTVEGSQTVVYRLLRSLSASSIPPHGFVQVIQTEVDPSATQAYEIYLARAEVRARPGPRNTPDPALRLRSGTVGDLHDRPILHQAGGKGRLTRRRRALLKAYGEADSRAILENSQKIVRRRTYQVDVYRPDLSRPPAQ